MKHAIYSCLKIDGHCSLPIYQQIVAGMEKFCIAGEKDLTLPSERDLCEHLQISRTILRKALNLCVEKGLLLKRWGKGYSIAGKKVPPKRFLILTCGDPDIANPYHYILPGIEQRAAELGIELDTVLDRFIYNRSETFVAKILKKYSGILYLNYTCGLEEGALNALRNCRIPLYCPHVLDRWAEKEHFYCGCVNRRQMFADALQELIAGGGEKIVTMTGMQNPFYDQAGIRGYTPEEYSDLLESMGADPDPELVLHSPCKKEDIYKALDGLRAKKKEFDSVLCMSDFYAIHVISYLKEHKYRIPEDVAVMGYCGFPGGQFLDPPLSTMDYQYRSIGYRAVDRLLEIASMGYKKLPLGGVIDPIEYVPCIRKSTRKAGRQIRKVAI